MSVTPKMMLEWFQRYQIRGHFYGSIPAAIHRLLVANVVLPQQVTSDKTIAWAVMHKASGDPLALTFNPGNIETLKRSVTVETEFVELIRRKT